MARVLIVEDEHLLRRILTLNLVRYGYSVAEADSVASAREALAAWDPPFDVILLDIELPDSSGWDLLHPHSEMAAITEMATAPPPGAPRVVVVTALRPPQAHLDALRPDAVLVKPFPLHALRRLIERVCPIAPLQSGGRERRRSGNRARIAGMGAATNGMGETDESAQYLSRHRARPRAKRRDRDR